LSSIWSEPAEALYRDLAAPKPAPAGVTAAAVCARLGIALLIKVLEIAGKRKNFAGDPKKLRELIEAAQRESAKLAEAADEDILADREQRRSAVPMKAAQAAEAGVALCHQARAIVTGAIEADLETATLLMQAGLDAIRACVRSNQARP
jgi:formiminotetrahydrofolate cyclodeaminase